MAPRSCDSSTHASSSSGLMPLEAAISFGCEHCAERQGISPTQERHHNLMWFDKKDNYLGCSQKGRTFNVRLQSAPCRIATGKSRRQTGDDEV